MKTKTRIIYFLLTVCLFDNAFGQSDIAGVGTGHVGVSGYYVGWNSSTAIPLEIRTNNTLAPQPIEFYTANALRMTIGTAGTVGILTTPGTNGLLVNNSIDLLSSAFGEGYKIGNKLLLSKPGTNNTFLGENAGINLTSGTDNFFAGFKAGQNNSSGSWNTFIGSEAGANNTTGEYNAFVGQLTGNGNTTGSHNTYYGHHSGYSNTTGSFNVLFGYHAGYGTVGTTASLNTFIGYFPGESIYDGERNTALGNYSGFNLTSGDENVLMGNFAGRFVTTGSHNVYLGSKTGWSNYTGSNNTYVGDLAGTISNLNLSNSAAFGSGATVLHNDEMIFGNNSVNVGIGLSGNTIGPRSKLEIKSGTTGVSGLQFTDLTSSFSPSTTATKFLSVDGNGKVYLAADPGASVNAGNGLSMVAPTTVGLGGSDLFQDAPIGMLGNHLRFDGSSNSDGTIGMGTNLTIAKLNVSGSYDLAGSNNYEETAAYFESIEINGEKNYGTKTSVMNADSWNIGSDILINSALKSTFNAGVHCNLMGTSGDKATNYGGYF